MLYMTVAQPIIDLSLNIRWNITKWLYSWFNRIQLPDTEN